jgi:hypothetical protein
MAKLVAIALLWFYCGWYAGAFLAFALGVSPAIGPILGAAVAVVVVSYVRRAILSTKVRLSVLKDESVSAATRQPAVRS